MRKSVTFEEKLARLNELRERAASAETRRDLAHYLSGRGNLLAAKAAQIAGEHRALELIPNLLDAFSRFLVQGEISDKGCAAKTAIAEALAAMEYAEPEPFLRGLRHAQREPVWGGTQDTAGRLRAVCILGLMGTGYPDAVREAVDLLADPQPEARAGAARAVAAAGRDDGLLALRLKARLGDASPEVEGECFAALLALDPAGSRELVTQAIDAAAPATAEAAAMALGESRIQGAFELLKQRMATRDEIRRGLLLGMALLREPEAVAFLEELAAARDRDAREALRVLGRRP